MLSASGQKIKKKLQSLKEKKRLLKTIQRQIANARAEISGIRAVAYDNEKVQGGSKKSIQERFIDLITKLETKEKNLISEIFELEKILIETCSFLSEIEQIILYERYVNCCSWKQIQKHCFYAEAQIYRLHDEAIERLAMDEKTKEILLN